MRGHFELHTEEEEAQSLILVSADVCILQPDPLARRKDILLLFSASLLAAGSLFQQRVLWSAQLQHAEASGSLIGGGNKCFQSQTQPIVEGQLCLTNH